MRISRSWVGPALALAVLTSVCLVTAGQQEGATAPVRVLVVDETKTFLSTMRVGGLVGGVTDPGQVLGRTVRMSFLLTNSSMP